MGFEAHYFCFVLQSGNVNVQEEAFTPEYPVGLSVKF